MVLAALVLAMSPQAAPPPADSRRPEELEVVRTKTAYTLKADELQVDGVLSFIAFDDKGNRPEFDLTSFTAEATYGITDWLTGEIEIPLLHLDPDPGDTESGIGDIALELKAAFSRNLVPIDLAAGIRTTLTTGDEDRGLGGDNSIFMPFAAVSYPFLPWMTGHGEVYAIVEEDRRPFHGLNLAADAVPWGPDLSLLLAFNVRRQGSDAAAWSIVPGAEYRWPEKSMAFALGLPIGLNSRAEDFGVIADFQIRL